MLRAALAGLSGLLAVVLLPVALVAVWLHAVVADTERYVEAVRPLAGERPVRAAVEDVVTTAVRKRLGGLDLGSLGVPLSDEQVTAVVREAVRTVVAGDIFPRVWATAQRSGHREALRLLESRRTPDTAGGRVVLPLDPVVEAALERLSGRGVPIPAELPALGAAVPLVPAEQLGPASAAYRLLDAGWLWLPVAVAGAALLSLLIARRRTRALGWLALLSAGALLATVVVVGLGRSLLVATTRTPAEEVIAGRMAEALTADLSFAALVGAGVCGVLGVVAVVLGGRRRPG